MLLTLLALLVPLALAGLGLALLRQPDLVRGQIRPISALAGGLGLLVALTSAIVGLPEGGLARLDLVSAVMVPLVAGLGWVVLSFSSVSLRDEPEGAPFMGWISLALAAVLTMVLAAHVVVLWLAWIALAACVYRLFLTYPERPMARAAARKYLLSAGIASVALGLALAGFASGYGTFSIAGIAAAAEAGVAPDTLGWSVAALILAAITASALFPLSGWLTEAMEAPTPFSALLHAGIVNAGGVWLLIFADLLVLAPGGLAVLALIGGASALVGALVMLTQPAIKTALAWSTVSQMGFLMLQIGLALFPLALLHIVAHALYKAHALLNSGTAVAAVTEARGAGPVALPDARVVAGAFALALTIYGLGVVLFGALDKAPQALALGMILILGIAYLIAQGMAGGAPRALALRLAGFSAAATVAYLALQGAAEALARGHLPVPPAPGAATWAVIALALVSFTLVAVAQTLLPRWSHHPAARAMRVHLSNGLYATAILDRLLRRAAA
ncbi:proton-conducting transporter membrane subunit [Dinoroseobacter sp. S375]|uniref:proton-conducting transporter transmembrane domain-containing protein n=1 Tax=Dinoroseobacter sp. S375 TaxID=3415136 RepID=UPI003C7C63A4